jgi:hypothetical protein
MIRTRPFCVQALNRGLPWITVASMALVAGCSPSPHRATSTRNGDLGQFILQAVASHGGHARATNGLPVLPGQWRAEVVTGGEYLNGREEVSVFLPPNQFQQVTGWLAQAFGEPSQPATLYSNGLIRGWYSIKDIGIGLQFYRDTNQTGLILVGELKR